MDIIRDFFPQNQTLEIPHLETSNIANQNVNYTPTTKYKRQTAVCHCYRKYYHRDLFQEKSSIVFIFTVYFIFVLFFYVLFCIWSFSGSCFSAFGLNIRDTQYLSVFSSNTRKYGPEKLQIRIIFTYCKSVMNSQKKRNQSMFITAIFGQY